MTTLRQTLVGGCLYLCGCSLLPNEDSQFTPVEQLDYRTLADADLPRSVSAGTRPTPNPESGLAHARLRDPMTAVPSERAPPIDVVSVQADSVAMSESGPSQPRSAQQDMYRYGADGRPILPPFRNVQIIDISSINKALEVDTIDADVLLLEAEEADIARYKKSRSMNPDNPDRMMVGTVRR